MVLIVRRAHYPCSPRHSFIGTFLCVVLFACLFKLHRSTCVYVRCPQAFLCVSLTSLLCRPPTLPTGLPFFNPVVMIHIVSLPHLYNISCCKFSPAIVRCSCYVHFLSTSFLPSDVSSVLVPFTCVPQLPCQAWLLDHRKMLILFRNLTFKPFGRDVFTVLYFK